MAEGVSGGPIFSRRLGLISVVTTGIGLTPGRSTEVEGPALSWIRSFLRRGRYAWALDGCVDVAKKSPPERLPLVPIEPVKDTASLDLSAVLAELAALRQTIEAMQLQPGPPGRQGPTGKPGPPGEDGGKGDKGDPGADYDFGLETPIDDLTDKQIETLAKLAKRLPPIYVRHVDDVTGAETIEVTSLGEGFTIHDTVPE